jgi:wyosine [tRNA(Phe)-imidazoG37] synthetase (radical SAM superfamily)
MILELKKGLTYGPVRSRRLGASLGINLFPGPFKRCPFDCVYCQYGWTREPTTELAPDVAAALPTPREVEEAVVLTLEALPELPAYLTFSGNGEPTIHPDFPEMVDRVNAIRARFSGGLKTAVLSNSARVTEAGVRAALARLDVRIMKLDCGTESVFRRYNRPPRGFTLDALTGGLRTLAARAPVTIQSLVAGGADGNLDAEEGGAWVERLAAINPTAVQLYTLARGFPAADLAPAPEGALCSLAAKAKARGVPVSVFR